MKTKGKILYFMPVDWNWIAQRPHFMALELQKEYDAVILAVGAYKRSHLDIEGAKVRNALDFLEEFRVAFIL